MATQAREECGLAFFLSSLRTIREIPAGRVGIKHCNFSTKMSKVGVLAQNTT